MKETNDISKPLATLPGMIIGAGIVVTALVTFWVASRGFAYDQSGWALGWSIVGMFFLAAGVAAIVGTWWHNNRVNRR